MISQELLIKAFEGNKTAQEKINQEMGTFWNGICSQFLFPNLAGVEVSNKIHLFIAAFPKDVEIQIIQHKVDEYKKKNLENYI